MKKRLLSILLALCMALSLLPGTALAVEMPVEREVSAPRAEEIENFNEVDDISQGGVLPDTPYETSEIPPETGSELALYDSSSWITYPVTGGNLYFDPATGAIRSCDESVTEAAIPSNISGVAVTDIGSIFQCMVNLRSVTIPNTITEIQAYAFNECHSLRTIHIPDSVISIGEMAFLNCYSLDHVVIPDSVTAIDRGAFSNCSSLSDITIPASTVAVGRKTENDPSTTFAFPGCPALQTAGPIGDSVDYNIKFGWTESIPRGAFSGCANLVSVSLPKTITSIGANAFSSCSQLERVYLPDGVTSIGHAAFSDCSKLIKITVPSSVTTIGVYSFSGCEGLVSAGPAGSDSNYEFGWTEEIPKYAFYGCSGLTSLMLPKGVTSIGDGALIDCGKLQSLVIPDSVTRIGANVFLRCNSLADIVVETDNQYYFAENGVLFERTILYLGLVCYPAGKQEYTYEIPSGVTDIMPNAFNCCENLTGIIIPNSVEDIWEYAFNNCANLHDVFYYGTKDEWEALQAKIGQYNESLLNAAIHCDYNPRSASGTCGENLTWVLDSAGTLTISGTGAMENYGSAPSTPWYDIRSSITAVVIENGVTSIGDCAFYELVAATTVSIPGTVTSIGRYAFYGCSALKSVEIPDSVIHIGSRAFTCCFELTSVSLPQNLSNVSDYLFYLCGHLQSVTIPASVEKIGDYAFCGCGGLKRVFIVEGTKSIGECAFSNCYRLETISIPQSVTSIGSSAFNNTSYHPLYDRLSDVYYAGTEAQWNAISIGIYNGDLISARRTYEAPADSTTIIGPVDITWTVNDGVLTVGGAGYIPEYGSAPWYEQRADISAIVIESGVIGISDSAFKGLTAAKTVSIPDTVTTIGSKAFSDCSALESVEIPDNVIYMWNNAFQNCRTLTSVSLSQNLRTISDDLFRDCASLQSITIPGSVEKISDSAFFDCTRLKTVTILEGVKSIGRHAFDDTYGTSVLKEITIPKSVTTVEEYAFYKCWRLSDVYYTGTQTQWDAISFGDFNSFLTKNATIHYNQPEIPFDARRGVWHLPDLEWDSANGAYRCGQLLITDSTVLVGADSLDELRGRYVLAEYVETDLRWADAPGITTRNLVEALRITSAECQVGTVDSVKVYDWPYSYDVVIDGTSYAYRDLNGQRSPSGLNGSYYKEAELPGQRVHYVLLSGELIDMVKLYPYTGILEAWDGTKAVIDGRSYTIDTNHIASMPEIGSSVGLSTDERISSSGSSSTNGGTIYELSQRSYETQVGTLDYYAASARIATVDGKPYPVNTFECSVDPAVFNGKQVFFLLANGEIVHMDSMEKTAYRLRVDLGIYSSNTTLCVDYKNGALDMPSGPFEMKLSYQMSYAYPEVYSRFYDKAKIDAASEKSPVMLGSAAWSGCYGLRFSVPKVEGYTIQPGETVKREFSVSMESGYKPTQKEESVSGYLTVTGTRSSDGEAVRNQNKFVFMTRNLDYDKQQPEAPEVPADADTAVAAKRANEELEKISSFGLTLDTMKNLFNLEGNALHLFEKELLAVIAMSSIPKKTLQEKFEEKALKEVLKIKKPAIMVDYSVLSLDYEFQTTEYGLVTARFDCHIPDYRLSDKSFGKVGNIYYKILSNEKGTIDEKSGYLGGGATVDISNFVSAAWNVAEKELKSAYDKAWGKSANKISEFLYGEIVSRILNAGKISPKDITWKLLIWPSKNVMVNDRKVTDTNSSTGYPIRPMNAEIYAISQCPVDIFVYDGNGVLCGSIENNTVTKTSEAFGLSIEGGTKYITGLTEEYRLIYKATDSGFMSVEVEEFASAGSSLRQIIHCDVPLKEDITYIQSVTAQPQQPDEDYALLSGTGEMIPVHEVVLMPMAGMKEYPDLDSLEIIGWTVTDANITLVELVDRTDALSSNTIICAAKYTENGQMTAYAVGALDGDTATFAQPLSEHWSIYVLSSDYHPLTRKTPLGAELRYALH